MAEKPVLFSAPMVRVLLTGRKTQMRRIVKPQGKIMSPMLGRDDKPTGDWFISDPAYDRVGSSGHFPPYAVGDTLWVREAWTNSPDGIIYRATQAEHGITECDDRLHWKPSIHMPRRASRLTLRVTDVRAQRVQDISEEDAEAEGITGDDTLIGQVANPFRTAFADLWDSVNGPGAWERNDWVWAYTVEVVK